MSTSGRSSIKLYLESLQFVMKHRLGSYFLVPAIIGLFLSLCVIGLCYILFDYFYDLLLSIPVSWNILEYNLVGGIFRYVIPIAIAILLFWLLNSFFKYFIIIVNGPFMAPLSKRVEIICHGDEDLRISGQDKFHYSILRSIHYNGRLIISELLIGIFVFALQFIPILGALVAILSSSYFAGRGNMDYVLERYYNATDSLKWGRNHKKIAFSIGLPYVLLLQLPVVGFMLAPPLATVAATLSCTEQIRSKT